MLLLRIGTRTFKTTRDAVVAAFEGGELSKLPSDERRVLMFRYLCEMTLPDVAKRMGWESHSAAYNAQNRALRKLAAL